MGRLIRLRPRRASLYALEETIASLHEELQFTLNYAHSMVKDQNYRAAAEVIEEQRRSLVRATKRMEKAVAPEAPVVRKARVRAALVGVAATMALASGAFAAFGPSPKPSAPASRIEAIQKTSLALIQATTISDPVQLQAVLTDANATIAEVAALHPEDRALQLSLLDSVRKLQTVLKQNPNVPASVRAEAQKVTEQVKDVVDEVEETETKTSENQPTTPTETTAPATEPSV